MQEQVNEKTVSLIIKGAKFSGRMFEKALSKLLSEMKKQKQKGKQAKTYHGKQTVKQLIGQGAGVSNFEVKDESVRTFERIARKYGVDFAVKKDASGDSPKWIVFFKSRDSDALMSALNEYNTKVNKREKKPSLLAAMEKNMELIKNQSADRVKNKKQELDR